jgi:diadenylate cyclase
LQSLDRLRSRLDDSEIKLTRLEVASFSTYRSAVTVLQRAELMGRLGSVVEARTRTLGEEGRIASLQLHDLMAGVDFIKRSVVRDYLRPLRANSVQKALDAVSELTGNELEDPSRVGKELGFPDLDDPVEPRGYRILSQAGRLPDQVRDDIVRHFGSVSNLMAADEEALIRVEGVGETRAGQLRAFFDRLRDSVSEWEPVLD